VCDLGAKFKYFGEKQQYIVNRGIDIQVTAHNACDVSVGEQGKIKFEKKIQKMKRAGAFGGKI